MALPDQGMVQSNFGMEEQRPIAGLEAMFGQGLSQNNRVGGKPQQTMQPIQDRNNRSLPVFDVSGPIRAGGSGSMVMRPVPPDQMQDNNPIEQFLATLNPVQREQFLALPPEQQQAYASGGAGVPAQPNTVDPVLQSQGISETITDPLVRSLYFGSEGTPGFYNQLQQAGANLIGSDVPLQQTAGLDPLENQARQRAQAGLGAFQPYFTQQQDLINQAIGQSRRAQELQDPYFARAESQYGLGLQNALSGIDQARGIATGSVDQYGNRLGESENLLRGTLGGYNPNMTQQFYNPYEDRVVQQTIDDVMKAGDQQDIAARAQAISSGGESAFGSRARLGAEERREALGRGLGDALSNIRSRGFSEAQQTGMGEFARQRDAERAAASGLGGFAGSRLGAQQGLAGNLQQFGQSEAAARSGLAGGLLGIGAQMGAGASQLGSQLAGYGGQMAGIGQNLEALNRGQRSELAGYGADARNIADMQNQRQYLQQLQQQMRPLQTMQQIGSMLPGYQQAGSTIQSAYGMAPDPNAQGLGAAFAAYGALVPNKGN
jgi:hypothetical protein